ncbi:MAG: class aldolase/adducin family protein [Oscillospiraceae bacterium]|nr:class aldolase/adducin family protein [Oscillospiraceae bacterium]
MDGHEAKQSVAGAGRMLLEEGLAARTWGNVSCRVSRTSFAITPSGLSYEGMTADDVVLYDIETGKCTGSRRPSSEKGVHAAAYARLPDAGFVIHTHQTYASALGLAGFHPAIVSPEKSVLLGGIALARYGLPGTRKLRNHIDAALISGAHTILMAHHGALIVGRDRHEAFERAKLLELICKSACAGQPSAQGDTSMLETLAELATRAFPHVSCTGEPAVQETSRLVPLLRAQLDDMAQMIGPKLVSVAPQAADVLQALSRHPAVLVHGAGAICRAETQGDCDALRMLVEKSCVCFLHTKKLGASAALSSIDALLMRGVYLRKYSKQFGG